MHFYAEGVESQATALVRVIKGLQLGHQVPSREGECCNRRSKSKAYKYVGLATYL